MFDPRHVTNLELYLNKNSLAIRFGGRVSKLKELDNLGLVYAGGINPDNVVGLTRTLNQFFPRRFSVDIESIVRTEKDLDIGKVRDYLNGYKKAMRC
jgi:phosphoribosylanthranilate isomerase